MSPAQRRRAAHQYRRSAATFATVIMSAGLLIALIGGVGAWRGILTQSWPTAVATITTNALETAEETRTIPMTDKLRGGLHERVGAERLALSYRYSVDGVTFEGHNGTHPVSYDQQDPRRAYLKAGPSTTSVSLLTVGLVLLAVGFLAGRLQRRA
jgi:hypothetical protein